jgi:hypothetical protein
MYILPYKNSNIELGSVYTYIINFKKSKKKEVGIHYGMKEIAYSFFMFYMLHFNTMKYVLS